MVGGLELERISRLGQEDDVDFQELLMQMLAQISPELTGVVLAALPATKATIDFIRKFILKNLQGNVVQTMAAVVSAIWVLVGELSLSLFGKLPWQQEVAATLLATLVVWLGSVGLDQALKDTNDPEHRSRTNDGD